MDLARERRCGRRVRLHHFPGEQTLFPDQARIHQLAFEIGVALADERGPDLRGRRRGRICLPPCCGENRLSREMHNASSCVLPLHRLIAYLLPRGRVAPDRRRRPWQLDPGSMLARGVQEARMTLHLQRSLAAPSSFPRLRCCWRSLCAAASWPSPRFRARRPPPTRRWRRAAGKRPSWQKTKPR